MKKVLTVICALGILVVVGCEKDYGKATPEDEANLKKLAKEGIGTSNPPANQPAPSQGTPVNGKVDSP